MAENRQKKVVVELPEAKAQFFENYAREQGVSIAELVDHYIEELQQSVQQASQIDFKDFADTVPDSVNVLQSYQEYLLEKYR